MSKKSGYLQRLSAVQYARDTLVRNHMRTLVLDIVTITLGKMGLSKEQVAEFRDLFMETEAEFCEEVRDDFYGNKDPRIVYAKERIDRALREVVPDEMFLPFDERYRGGLKL